MAKTRSFASFLSDRRFFIQIVLGLSLYYFIGAYNISLWYVVAFGSVLGIIFGKVFCRWMCPVGIMMELMMKFVRDDSMKMMYQYHKLGCPIAWISGWLNSFSVYRISLNKDTCKNCGLCDKACYISRLDSGFSLYKKNKNDPGTAYSCSKCLNCVAKCPNDSLRFTFQTPFAKRKKIV